MSSDHPIISSNTLDKLIIKYPLSDVKRRGTSHRDFLNPTPTSIGWRKVELSIIQMSVDRSSERALRILCLDGGDARCVSQLYILGEFMHRLEQKTGVKSRPCDHFQLITGVDTSAPIAAFLGLFGMSVEEALEAFFKLYTTVFADETYTPETRADRLEVAIKELMKSEKYKIPENARLSDDVFKTNGCKVALCYAPAEHINHCMMFRNYQSPQQTGVDATLVEALRACWATPGLISSKFVGIGGIEEELVSAVNGFNNPTQEAIKEAYNVFGPEAHIACILSLGSGQRGVISLEEKDVTPRKLGAQMITDSEHVAEDIRKRIGRLRIYHRLSVDRGLEGWELFRRGFGIIKSHTDAYLSKDAVSGGLEECLNTSRGMSNVTMERVYRSRAKGRGAAHGLPPLSAFFVTREKPMRVIANGLLDNEDIQRIMVLSGLGGSGKTQLALKFAHDFEDSFDHIFFIDASSAENIEKELVDRVRSFSLVHNPKTVKEVMDILARPDEVFTKNWLLILDNADDIQVILSDYFPPCKHGSILITTRNVILENLAPNAHVTLDVMGPDEAIKALLAAVFPSNASSALTAGASTGPSRVASASSRDRELAADIVQHLGYFPLAVVQAGCYIRQQQCLHDYLDRFRANRLKLLQRPTRFQLDKLKYPHSVYAAFDTTAEAVSPRALQLLGILSFGHFSNFPRPLLGLAAKVNFSYEKYDLCDRTEEFQQTIQFLTGVLCPDGIWEEDELDTLLEELQQYSLITLVPLYSIIVFRLHPMVWSWCRDRLTEREQNIHRLAFARLLACGADPSHAHLFEHLYPHMDALSQFIDSFHVNERAALTYFLIRDGKAEEALRHWLGIYEELEKTYGKVHVRTSRAMLQLADAYSRVNDRQRMEAMEREVIVIRKTLLGDDNMETAKAKANLARTIRGNQDYVATEELEKDVLRTMIKVAGVWHIDTAQGMSDLAETMHCQGKYDNEVGLLIGVVDNMTRNLGRSNIQTIRALRTLADCYNALGNAEKTETLRKEVMELYERLFGSQHLTSINAMSWLAVTYWQQQRYRECEQLRRIELATRQEVEGEHELNTLVTMFELARVWFEQTRYGEAELLWNRELQLLREFHEEEQDRILGLLFWIGRCQYQTGRFVDAEKSWQEELAGREKIYPDTNDSSLTTVYWIARSCFEQKRFADAEKYWKEELEGRLLLHASHSDIVLNTLDWLGEVCSQQENFEEAEAYWKQELLGRQLIQSTSNALRLSHWIGEACYNAKKYEESRKWWAQEVIDRRAAGDNKVEELKAVHWLARALFMLEQYKEAARWFEEELAEQRQLHGDINVETLLPMFYLGKAHYLLGEYDLAEPYWKEELAARRTLHGELHEETIGTVYWMAQLYMRQKRYEEAKEWYLKELAGRQALKGENSPEALTCMYNLGHLCYAQAQYKDAEEWWAKELLARRTTQGDKHTDTLMAMKWLGEALFEQSSYDQAEPYWKEAATTFRELNGANHAETILLEKWTGDLYFAMSRFEDAQEWWLRMLPASIEVDGELGADTLQTKFSIGRACYRGKKYGEAEKWLEESLTGRRAAHGENDSKVVWSMHWLGDVMYMQGRYQEAEERWKQALEKWKELQDGEDHQDEILQATSWIGDAVFCLGRYDEAEEWWRQELAGRETHQGDKNVNTLRAIHWIGEARYKKEDYAEAVQLWNREVAGLQALHEDENHTRILDVKFGIARACMEQGQNDEAESIWKAVLEARGLGSRTLEIAKVNRYLAQLYNSMERYLEARKAAKEAISILNELAVKQEADAPASALKELTDSDATLLSDSTALLKSIEAALPPEALVDTDDQTEPAQLPVPEIETFDGASDNGSTFTEDASLPDPGGNPVFLSDMAKVSLPIIRPRSPFNMRATLGPRPSSWSMF